MKKTELLDILSDSPSPYALLSSLMQADSHEKSKLTPEQRVEREDKRRKLSEERVRQAKIMKNICPDCEGKLIRGKKEKKNGYKRSWKCQECEASHSL